jgi:hypothetical protein
MWASAHLLALEGLLDTLVLYFRLFAHVYEYTDRTVSSSCCISDAGGSSWVQNDQAAGVLTPHAHKFTI